MSAEKQPLLRIEDVIRLLRDEVERAGSQSEWARRTGVERTSLSRALSGRTRPTKDILKTLKLEKVVAYKQGARMRPR
jgi:DNA-binding phage protein